ncbi:MAG TPA: hypothetical protein DCF33_12105 [Saprospirales bacterium]|nr:hypothetical protein [Saprospirales bacterium]
MQNQIVVYLTILLNLSIGNQLSGQTEQRAPCGQDFFMQSMAISKHQFQLDLNYFSALQRSQIIIPVVFHIVWNTNEENISDELIINQLATLNRDFNAQNQDVDQVPDEFQSLISGTGITFCLASETPSGQPTNGIVRTHTNIEHIGVKDNLFFSSMGGSDAWNPDQYLNIWVANTGPFLSGFGTYPGQTTPKKTGVVIHPTFFGMNGHPRYGLGRTLVHEVGHYFGLYHVWSNDPLCEEDDGVEDTPKQMHQHTGCPTHPQTSCTESDMFMNFMDYVDDPCMVMFTAGQKEKIWTNIYQFRSGLLSNTTGSYCINTKQKDDLSYVISPNPVTNDLTISFPFQEDGIFDIQIYDILGRLHKDQKTLGNGQIVISLQHLEPGLYVIIIGKKSKTFVKL